MKCTSSWSKHKLSYTLAMETIQKRASFTGLPLYFDDVKSDRFLSKITEGFDDGQVYETAEVRYINIANDISNIKTSFLYMKTLLILLSVLIDFSL